MPAEGSASTAFLVTVVQAGPVEVLVDAKAPGVSASFSKTIDVTVSTYYSLVCRNDIQNLIFSKYLLLVYLCAFKKACTDQNNPKQQAC